MLGLSVEDEPAALAGEYLALGAWRVGGGGRAAGQSVCSRRRQEQALAW
jgi:hypothetical protein